MPAWMQRLKQAVAAPSALSPEEQYLQSMSPVDAYKFAQEAQNARVFSPEDAAANRQQTFLDALYATPLGNALSARDALESKWQGQQLEQQGDTEGARRAYAQSASSAGMAFLPGMGRIGMGRATEGAADAARIFAGPMAKTADHAALAQAQELAAKGISRDDIWRNTGWYQGVDGKWRFEIDDSQMGVKIPPNLMSGDYSAYSTAIDHPALFDAYPPMKRNRVTFDHRTANSAITLDANPNGLNGKNFDTEIGIKGKTRWGGREPLPEYVDKIRGSVTHEGQHNIQRREGFAEGDSPYNYMDRSSLLQALERARANNGLDPLTGDFDVAIEANLKNAVDDPFDVYRRSAGEVEARNAALRLNMTPEQRRATPPWLTQDVPDEQQIVRMK